MKNIYTYLAVCTNRIFATGERKTHISSINGLPLQGARVTGMEWRTSESKALISLKTKMGVQLQSHLLVVLNVTELLHTITLSCRGIELLTIWFQQDGATAHTARASM
jgi:hypothetical protein